LIKQNAGEDELLTINEVAQILRVPVATLRYWRNLGTGPASFRIGRGVRYWRSEVYRWLYYQGGGGAADDAAAPRAEQTR
jgi:predicted DNA-binding transcriptional regulator AlpA